VAITQKVTGLAREEAEKYLRTMSVDTGLITEERAGEVLRFIHLTFCEYLGAFEAVQGRPTGWDELIQRHREFRANVSLRTRLVEVLPFACALMPRHMRVQSIRDVADQADERVLALTFLETKLYNHALWPQFSATMEQQLLDADWGTIGPDWLRQVHLFMVVCADADRASRVLGSDIGLDRLASFFERLRHRADRAIYRLIDSYAEQDAAAAFRVSDLCQIDMLTELPNVIIKNCDQPPFLTLVMDLASQQRERLPLWSCILAEAGLRSAATANALDRSSVNFWTADADKIKRSRQWFCADGIRRTPYSECLTVACNFNLPIRLEQGALVRS
jgi:hypothetical protein